jgi:hypothetical protein
MKAEVARALTNQVLENNKPHNLIIADINKKIENIANQGQFEVEYSTDRFYEEGVKNPVLTYLVDQGYTVSFYEKPLMVKSGQPNSMFGIALTVNIKW